MTTTKPQQDYEPNLVLSNTQFDVIGSRPIRHDGADKVTGRANYGADFPKTSPLQGKILRSSHAHARIKSIDTSKAEALEGVQAVVTGKDFPDPGGRPGPAVAKEQHPRRGQGSLPGPCHSCRSRHQRPRRRGGS